MESINQKPIKPNTNSLNTKRVATVRFTKSFYVVHLFDFVWRFRFFLFGFLPHPSSFWLQFIMLFTCDLESNTQTSILTKQNETIKFTIQVFFQVVAVCCCFVSSAFITIIIDLLNQIFMRHIRQSMIESYISNVGIFHFCSSVDLISSAFCLHIFGIFLFFCFFLFVC